MSRELPEWIGKNDDTPIPPRVKVRIFEKASGVCAICTLRIGGKLLPAYDHILAIINGGANRESNLQLICTECHKNKTATDVKEKSIIYHKKAKNIGISLKQKKPFPGSKASGWKKTMSGKIIRR